jgi:hypothetical protein
MQNLIISLLSLCLSLLTTNGFAVTTKDVFYKYPNKYFVETGTLIGGGVQMALDSGYKQVYSIELSPHYYQLAKERFKDQKNVHIIQGDSAKILGSIISKIKKPITFWLDGHCSMDDTAKGETMTPLMLELEAIRQHPIKTHTIMIDDVRQFGTFDFDFLTLEQAINKIMSINPNYKIVFEDGYVKNDVLVAYIE